MSVSVLLYRPFGSHDDVLALKEDCSRPVPHDRILSRIFHHGILAAARSQSNRDQSGSAANRADGADA